MQKQNIGNAGEYYISARLSAEDFVVTITIGRAEKYDVLMVAPNGRTKKISVKTRREEKEKRFPLSPKDESGGADDFFYILVRLNEFKKEPDFWVIPSKRVNYIVAKAHREWKKTPKLDGTKRKPTDMRNLWIEPNKGSKPFYPEDWEEEVQGYYKNLNLLK